MVQQTLALRHMEAGMAEDDLERFHLSLERVLACKEFLDMFYDSFIGNSDRVKNFFKHTDMARQKRKLSTTLRLITMAADDSPGADIYLEYLGKYHHDIKVTEDLFDQWLVALIDSAKKCDPKYNDELEAIWRTAINLGIQHMHKAYEH
ncbi:MAG: globin [Gammaproteobacteria bacterium]|nr:globin [Gammaproteobacteria bacterium]